MIEFAKIIGELDKNYLRVRVRTGEEFLAPITVMGTGCSLPSEKWIEKNKDNFLALVTYEKNMYISPMIIGFYPVKGAKSESYDALEKLMEISVNLIDMLLQAKVNTMLGPQPFFPVSLEELNKIKASLDEVSQDIQKLDL